MKKILILVGTRPNFIKITQFRRLFNSSGGFDLKIVHTGQHFDANMADVFFQQLDIVPDFFLNISSVSPIQQIADIMVKLEAFISDQFLPDLIMVPGDVNSTLAGALVANKLNIKLAHLESGLRSFDRNMPEEHNRVLTDHLSDICFVTETSGLKNLESENTNSKVFHVGNTMIDTLVHFENAIQKSKVLEQFELAKGNYILMTMHRPSNVDEKVGLTKILELLGELTVNHQVILPMHPRTLKSFERFNLLEDLRKINHLVLADPMGYFEFQKLIKYSLLVITDSGGIQEETTYRRVPCLTIRPNTERPITCEEGTNTLLEFNKDLILEKVKEIESGSYKKGKVPKLWDGNASNRIVETLQKIL